eukprot:4834390-Lingulodinium_polyedra.AAC.1
MASGACSLGAGLWGLAQAPRARRQDGEQDPVPVRLGKRVGDVLAAREPAHGRVVLRGLQVLAERRDVDRRPA